MTRRLWMLALVMPVFMSCQRMKRWAVRTQVTPYDEEWERVKKCLLETSQLEYCREPKSEHVWRLPATIQEQGKGDCTAFATMLYQKMLQNGIRDGRIVFGYHGDLWHAWVAWRGYVLDATRSPVPLKPEADEYYSLWGYDLAGKYRFIGE